MIFYRSFDRNICQPIDYELIKFFIWDLVLTQTDYNL